MKKITLLSLLIALFTSFIQAEDNGKITILHTNDIHGSFVPMTIKSDQPDKPERKLGGFLALDDYVKKIRSNNTNLLLLDAGDFMTGNPICDIEVNGVQGGAMIQFFNLLQYDGQTLGNHEFDISLKNIRQLTNLADYPFFSANLFTIEKELFTENPYHIYQKGDLSIGVIGVIVDDLPEYINAPQKNQVFLKPAASVVDSLATVLDPQTDLIIVLSHSGLGSDKSIAQKVGSVVDLIIGGHSHTRMKEAEKVNGVLIVQAGDKLRNVGKLELSVKNDRIENYDYALVPLWNEDIESNPELEKLVKKYQEQIDKEYGRVIGKLLTPWRRSYHHESNLGNFVADVIRKYMDSDVAAINSGGLRQNLNAGPITKLDIKNILPFSNTITYFTATGQDILDFVELNARASAYDLHGILQVSGIKYEYEKLGNGEVKILGAWIHGIPLNLKRNYTFATVDFVVANAEKYLGFEPKNVQDTMTLLTDAVTRNIEERKRIRSKVAGRMIQK